MLAPLSVFNDAENVHTVQFYDADERALVENVLDCLAGGIAGGGSAVMVATAAHREAFCMGLAARGIDADKALHERKLVALDADATLRRFIVNGYPDGMQFDATVGSMVRENLERAGGKGLRVYGEMVGLLWESGQYPAAIRLEQLWDGLRRKIDFTLFCGYPIDVFGHEFQSGVVDALLCAHSHLLPTGASGRLTDVVTEAMKQVLGAKRTLELLPLLGGGMSRAWGEVPRGESMILWLRKTLPDEAGEVLALARTLYSD